MLTTLTGSNSFQLQAELHLIIDAFISQHTNMGLERLDGEEAEYDRIREALESLPFLASKKLVVIRSGSMNKRFVEQAERLLTGLPDTTDVVLVEPKVDKRSSYYKLLKKITEFKEFPELESIGLARWLTAAAKERGGELTLGDARLLIDRVGANQQLLSQELDKLLAYNEKISKDAILLITEQAPHSTTFDLLDAALSGHTKKAIALYEEQRMLKAEPVQIIALLAWQLHVLALIKTAGNRDAATIAKEARLNPFVVRKSTAIANRMSLAEVKELVRTVRDLDIRLKSEPIDPDEAMLHLLIHLRQQ